MRNHLVAQFFLCTPENDLRAQTASLLRMETNQRMRSLVSKHIKVLTECELVKQEYSGREIYYHLNAKKMKEVDKWLERFRSLWDTRFNQLDDVLKNLKNKKS